MATKIDIYNRALQQIQGKPIQSLTENTRQRKVLDGFYDSDRQAVLVSHKWSFATEAIALASIAVPDSYTDTWSYAYNYPADILKILRVYQKGGLDCGHVIKLYTTDFNEQTRIILSNSDQALCDCVRDVTQTAYYPTSFTEAFVMKLASSIATPLTGNIDLQALFLQKYQLFVDEAKKSDSEDNKKRCPEPLDSYSSARMGSGIHFNNCCDRDMYPA